MWPQASALNVEIVYLHCSFMSDGFNKKLKELFSLYEKKKYLETCNLALSLMGEYNRKMGLLYNVAYCTQSLMGNTDRAIELLTEAADHGYWSDPDQLLKDDDLKSVREDARFQTVVERFRTLSVQYAKDHGARMEILEPEDYKPGNTGSVPLIIALHGNTQSADDSREDWSFMTRKGWIVALPQSSQASMEGSYVWNNFEIATPELKSFFKEILSRYNIDSNRIVIAGFSMGGALAADICLKNEIPGGKFILMGPYIADVSVYTGLVDELGKRNGQGYIVVGENDADCIQGSKELAVICKEHHVECIIDIVPGIGHEFPDHFPDLVSKAMHKLGW